MSIVWERGNDPRQMENNNVSPPLLSGAPVTTGGYNDFVKSTLRRAVTWISEGQFYLDCFMFTRYHDCMIIGNESDPMNFLILLIETRPCNFIDLESLLNNAIFALKN